MSEIKQIDESTSRIVIDDFDKIDLSVSAVKLPINRFVVLENFLKKKVQDKFSLQRRNGIAIYNTNAVTANAIVNLFEAKLNDGYYMLAKDNAGAGSSTIKYNASEYTGSWTQISNTEYAGFYRYLTFKNSVYACNRIDGSGNLLSNKIWQGSTNWFDVGAIPPQQNDPSNYITLTPANVTSGGMTSSKYYWYIVTYLYDGYQESAVFAGKSVLMGASDDAVNITKIPTGSARVKARKIYRSLAQDSSISPLLLPEFPAEFYYIATITDNTTTTYSDAKTDDELVNPIASEDFFQQKRPYKSKHSVVVSDRLVQANLETYSEKYSAISASDITLTKVPAGTLTGNYKYRFYKAYAMHSGGKWIYMVGDYVEKSITGLASEDVNIAFSGATAVLSDQWVEKIIVTRTKAGGTTFFVVPAVSCIATEFDIAFNKYALSVTTATDSNADADLDAFQTLTPNIIEYAEETVINQKFKGFVSYCDDNNGVTTPDLVSPENVKGIDFSTTQGITAFFAEDSRAIAFTPTNIYALNIGNLSPGFWTIDKVVSGIGASGQDTSPKTETTGHSGVQQLPNDTGYFFFNRATATTGQTIKAYLWDGRNYPELVSNEIDTYLNNGFSTFRITGMSYDRINNWVWTVITSSTGNQNIYIYDLEFKAWYIMTFNNAVVYYDMVITENNKTIFGGNLGKIHAYTQTAYRDDYDNIIPLSYTSKIQTKTFDEFDAETILRRILINLDVSTTSVTLQTYIGIDGSAEVNVTLTDSSSGTYYRLRNNRDDYCKRFYYRIEHSENKNLILNDLSFDMRVKHVQRGG